MEIEISHTHHNGLDSTLQHLPIGKNGDIFTMTNGVILAYKKISGTNNSINFVTLQYNGPEEAERSSDTLALVLTVDCKQSQM